VPVLVLRGHDIRMHAVEITDGCRFDIGLGMGRNVVDSSRAKEMARARKCSTVASSKGPE
jgi:hypothetical protein